MFRENKLSTMRFENSRSILWLSFFGQSMAGLNHRNISPLAHEGMDERGSNQATEARAKPGRQLKFI